MSPDDNGYMNKKGSVRGLAEHRKALDFARRGKLQMALRLHAKACRLNPSQPEFAKEHALCLLDTHYPSEAKREFRRSLDLSWGDPEVVLDVCIAIHALHLHALLLSFLEPRKDTLPDSVGYFYASSLARHERADEAMDYLSSLGEEVRIRTPFLQVLWVQLLLQHRSAVEAMLAADKVPMNTLVPKFQVSLLYARAHASHRVGEREKVFQWLRQAKQINRSPSGTTAPQAAQRAKLLNRAVLNASVGAPPAMSGRGQGLAVLCGHPRSGTTLIEQMLDRHPAVSSVEEQSVFFDLVMTPLSASGRGDAQRAAGSIQHLGETARDGYEQDYRAALQRYLPGGPEGQEAAGETLFLDKYPDMSLALGTYHELFPAGKMVVALRDPRDVVLSCYFQDFPMNPGSLPYLDLKTTAEKYILTMEAWLETRDTLASGFLETRYEDWVNEPDAEARRVLDFLSLPWDGRVLSRPERGLQRVVTSPTYHDVGKEIYRDAIGRWRDYQKQLQPVLPILEPICLRLGYGIE
ncbi:sulfotransferase [Verrucomicrobiaceae bacterium N1E253]|uniref:Sulfotransferase n=1 Tax=Oceaniferula marina TaxID=2748318 RepID=A0A851GG22_9BACT|nr:sulfotransferase [Oceaniferula marina]NWK54751.1 sulfotransferase [Oceaniferula marina]